MNGVFAVAKQYIHRAIAYLVSFIIRPGAVFDPVNFRLWEKRNYHITPVHFHYPIPDTRELQRAYPNPTESPGLDLRPEFQLGLLKEVFPQFSAEYNAFPVKPSDSESFYLENDAFNGIDPHVYYGFVRHFKPRTVIEVGSGYSTLLGVHACRMNGVTRYICIDPWPRDFISNGVRDIEFMHRKVEKADISLFLALRQNDILFVDSSHVVRTGEDVCFIILEILPRLSEGVIIHFHDIFLPFEYPRELVVEKHLFWTEQYLLQAYLAENSHIEVLFASNFISKKYLQEVKGAFPKALWHGGGSFWLIKR